MKPGRHQGSLTMRDEVMCEMTTLDPDGTVTSKTIFFGWGVNVQKFMAGDFLFGKGTIAPLGWPM